MYKVWIYRFKVQCHFRLYVWVSVQKQYYYVFKCSNIQSPVWICMLQLYIVINKNNIPLRMLLHEGLATLKRWKRSDCGVINETLCIISMLKFFIQSIWFNLIEQEKTNLLSKSESLIFIRSLKLNCIKMENELFFSSFINKYIIITSIKIFKSV